MGLETLIMALHILGAGIMVAAPFFALIFYLKKQLTPETIKLLKTTYKVLPFIAGSQLVTGLWLFMEEPAEFKENPLFWLKMVLYIADGLFATFVLERRVKQALQNKAVEKQDSQLATFFLVNLLILIAIVTLSVSL